MIKRICISVVYGVIVGLFVAWLMGNAASGVVAGAMIVGLVLAIQRS